MNVIFLPPELDCWLSTSCFQTWLLQ